MRTTQILLVEDNPGDIELIAQSMNCADMNAELTTVANGLDALKLLNNDSDYGDATRPDLIILDINLPIKNGLEVLAEIKSNADLKSIPVIVLTSSAAEDEILECYKNYANACMTKPVNTSEFTKLIWSIKSFWLNQVNLPSYLASNRA